MQTPQNKALFQKVILQFSQDFVCSEIRWNEKKIENIWHTERQGCVLHLETIKDVLCTRVKLLTIGIGRAKSCILCIQFKLPNGVYVPISRDYVEWYSHFLKIQYYYKESPEVHMKMVSIS